VLRVIIYQASISIVVALVFLSLDSATIFSSMYGGIVSILNTLLLARSVNAAGKAASEQEQTRSALVLVKSVVIRFTLVLVSFYIGIVYLKLVALEILIAFALAQLGYVFYKSKSIY
jgi:F0F1-type ATP synthase assembly protein I